MTTQDVIDAPSARAAVQLGHGGSCNCPRSTSRCRFAVLWDHHHGDHSLGHGGWGWPS